MFLLDVQFHVFVEQRTDMKVWSLFGFRVFR